MSQVARIASLSARPCSDPLGQEFTVPDGWELAQVLDVHAGHGGTKVSAVLVRRGTGLAPAVPRREGDRF